MYNELANRRLLNKAFSMESKDRMLDGFSESLNERLRHSTEKSFAKKF